MTKLCLLTAICGSAALALTATAASTLDEVFSEGKVSLQSRARLETASVPGVRSSSAATLRNRLGFTSGKFNGFSFMIEGEDVHAFDADSYNQAGLNPGGAGRVVIADIEGTEVNQSWIAYHRDGQVAKLGRQRWVLDGARYIGDVGWRQDMQTFDAFTYSNTSIDGLTANYGYLWQVNRIFSDIRDWESDSHAFNVSYANVPGGKITGYAYLLEFGNAAANSTATYGASYAGSTKIDDGITLSYRLEAATQSDYGNSAFDYSTSYYVGELGANFGSFKVLAGYEVLGSDNGQGFKTPLATLHKFNGFADVFLGTPGTGLEDFYFSAGISPTKALTLGATYHDFRAENGGASYGSEVDLVAVYKFAKGFTSVAKYASYDSEGYRADIDRFSIEVNYAY
ncbi:MAG: alginate export family protein [Synoicihabitans sp.]